MESISSLLSKIPGNVGMTEWLGQLYLDAEHALSVELLVFFYRRGGLSRTILSLVMANAPLVFPLPQGINNERDSSRRGGTECGLFHG